MSMEYSERRARKLYKRIIHKIQKYPAQDIIFTAISRLNRYEVPDIQELRQCPPWIVLLLIKWTILNGQFSTYKWRPISEIGFANLINKMHDLNGLTRSLDDYDHYFLFFKSTAHQQFWLQKPPSRTRFARQSLLFKDIETDHTLSKIFEDHMGVSIKDFITLGLVLLTRFLTHKDLSVNIDWFRTLFPVYPKNKIDAFLRALSLDFEELRRYLDSFQDRSSSLSYEFFEQSPLKRYPLLRYEGQYYCYSKTLLFNALETGVYDTLRMHATEAFMNKFGNIFEEYVKNKLEFGQFEFEDEEKLKQAIGNHSKVIDFVIKDGKSKIFVDAKGVELAHLGKVTHKSDVILGKTKNSIVKGIVQGYETASHLAQAFTSENNTNDNYLIIVTFDDLYIGSGQNFYSTVAREKLDEIIEKYGKRRWIPPENMYFLSIDDFDFLIACMQKSKLSLTDILLNAVRADAKPETSKLTFGQHLHEICSDVEGPEYLDKEFERLFHTFDFLKG